MIYILKQKDNVLNVSRETIYNLYPEFKTAEVMFYPKSIIINAPYYGAPSILDTITYNVLLSNHWVDAMTELPDHKEMNKINKAFGKSYSPLLFTNDIIYYYIIYDDMFPLPSNLVYICSNLIVGKELIFRELVFNPKHSIQRIKKEVNESENRSEDEGV
jgi:hypothetical protein